MGVHLWNKLLYVFIFATFEFLHQTNITKDLVKESKLCWLQIVLINSRELQIFMFIYHSLNITVYVCLDGNRLVELGVSQIYPLENH